MISDDETPDQLIETPPEERLYPVAEGVELVTGQRPSPATAARWRQRGIAGVKLKTVRLGGRRMVSLASVREFVEAITQAADGVAPQPKSRTNSLREKSVSAAERRCAELGI